MIPGLYLCGRFTPPVLGAFSGSAFRSALMAKVFRGAFPPVDFRAVCLVRAMTELGSEDLGSKYPLYDQCVTMRKIGYKANKNRHKEVREAYNYVSIEGKEDHYMELPLICSMSKHVTIR